ncbi:MAG: RNA polymerase sigma factor [Chitinophagales bacterium]|nr:RNA polymerase sigma factor [Chitinophagales bacterium]
MSDKEILALFMNPATREKGFRGLMDTYQVRLYSVIRKMVKKHDDTNDILQNTFIKAWKGLSRFRSDSGLFTWLYRIAYNETVNFVNANKKHNAVIPAAVVELGAKQIVSHRADVTEMDGEQIQLKLKKAIDELPPKQRMVFVMRYYDELTYDEISNITGTSVGGLKASYHHAVKKIEEFVLND